jgi:hypothetical protein
MENPAYQVVYNVGLLDDIHNYFPALLYDQGRFQTLPGIFSYVRHQMNTRFNLYAYGSSLAGRGPAANQPAVPAEEDVLTSLASMNLLLSLIQPGFIPASRIPTRVRTDGADIWASFRSPVVVAPSAEIIAANTQIVQGSELPSGTVCSVCQDAIVVTESCRRLTACQHVYHRVCIDQWFTRSVFCPSCRHDIRIEAPRLQEPVASPLASPVAAPVAAPTASPVASPRANPT